MLEAPAVLSAQPPAGESAGKRSQRHKQEIRNLDQWLKKTYLKSRKGKQKAAAQSQAEEWRQELLANHAKQCPEAEGVDAPEAGVTEETGMPTPAGSIPLKDDGERLSKAARRRLRQKERAQKEQAEMDAQIAEMRLNGGEDRVRENKEFDALLSPLSLCVKQIPSDGSCLYRAVADQLQRVGVSVEHRQLRAEAADYILAHADEYTPLLTEGIEEYCDKLRNTNCWGGELEISVLATVRSTPIVVYIAGMREQRYGGEGTEEALLISFHRSYFALGNHYNSVVPMVTKTSPVNAAK
ncbi:hypothetical protein KIPB_006223 [Kipferlia bialata]|uniref:OTU domain-containing protein n=1 Tax=Kipferlia bialata TaxID=797122 RepID=A0A9K3GH34_9EUKA|nr:hypothetical protein KIPB_003963 [Kipferlia bialata]GIQ84681.1 hypothetical protein KIPB_006223 [Kipferlia bialata]|eukprot:g3963.t1